MRQTSFSRLLAMFLTLSLAAVACSSRSDVASNAASGSDDDASTATTDDAGDADADASSSDGEGIDVEAPVDPEDVRTLAASLTGVDVAEDQLTCMTNNAEGDTQLGLVYNGYDDPSFQFTPEAFTALTVNIHDCIDAIDLAGSLVSLSGGSGDLGAFVSCVNGQLSDEQNGDLTYTGLAALQVSFPVPEGAQEITIGAASECVGAESLAAQLAASREQASGFVDAVDRECVEAGMTDEFVEAFWEGIITAVPASTDFEPLIEGCTEVYDSGLEQELPADFDPFSGTGALAAVDPSVRNGVYTEAPDNVLEDGVDYQARLTTDDGVIVIDLYEDTAPITVNSFVALARDGYYDLTNFHRVLDGFMAQAGDPSNTGGGGPGYSFDDEDSGLTAIDRRGLLAMANSGPNTNGSQFFITLDAATWLDGLHTVFGEVVEGDDVLAAIELRNPDAPSSRGEQIISIEIVES